MLILNSTAKLLQLCPILWDSRDCNPPGSWVHGILQARMLEWVAISFSRGIFLTQGSNPHLLHLLHWLVGSLPPAPLDNVKLSSEQYALPSAVCTSDCSHYPLQRGRLLDLALPSSCHPLLNVHWSTLLLWGCPQLTVLFCP